jgi:hypothetical protein
LVSNTVEGTGALNRSGGASSTAVGGNGIARVEANTNTFAGTVDYQGTPIALDLPGSPNGPPAPASIMVTSVNGTTVNANPFSFPNLNLNTGDVVPIVITAHNVPVGTQPTLYMFAVPNDQTVTAPPLEGTLATSTSTVFVTVPFGGTFGFVKAVWTQ